MDSDAKVQKKLQRITLVGTSLVNAERDPHCWRVPEFYHSSQYYISYSIKSIVTSSSSRYFGGLIVTVVIYKSLEVGVSEKEA